jgi:hypothetical protein
MSAPENVSSTVHPSPSAFSTSDAATTSVSSPSVAVT